jgi:hypothetical protein
MESLGQKLDALREGAKQRVPAEVREIMKRAIDELRDSGIAASVLQAGDTIPPFELPNVEADLVSSDDLLQRGPLIITFYRGVW